MKLPILNVTNSSIYPLKTSIAMEKVSSRYIFKMVWFCLNCHVDFRGEGMFPDFCCYPTFDLLGLLSSQVKKPFELIEDVAHENEF